MIHPGAIALSMIVAGLASASCGETGPPAARTSSFALHGTVTDRRMAGLAIPGASVRLEDRPTTAYSEADSRGRYRLSGVPEGRIRVAAAAPPSYEPSVVDLYVGADRTLDIGLAHTGTPPFWGALWVSPEILGPDDGTSFGNVTYTGRGTRSLFDRRANAWITVNAYLFDVRFGERTVEWQFNPEFGSAEAAEAEIETFGPPLGRLPAALLANVREVDVNAGSGLFGGNSYDGSLLIHTEDAVTRLAVDDGFLEELFMHEAAHASLDSEHSYSPEWLAAQHADGVAISDYASHFPLREDVAETIVPYFAVRYRPGRLTAPIRWLMTMTTPNRLAYFDDQNLDMSPYARQPYPVATPSPTWTLPARSDALGFEGPPAPPKKLSLKRTAPLAVRH